MRTYIYVPYIQKDEAKALGARWDPSEKKWYYTDSTLAPRFQRWAEPPASRTATNTKQPSFQVPNIKLSDEQQEFIRRVKAGENVLVDACIGSGKTTAIQALCRELPEKRILYLTYNRLLKEDARRKIPNRWNITVTNYHGFAYQALKNTGINVGVSDLIQTFNSVQPPLPAHYDLLVLDEYQDIELETSLMLDYIKSVNPGMQIAAVGDMMQKIYDKTVLNVPQFIERFLGQYTLMQFTICFRLQQEYAARLGNIWGKTITGVNRKCSVKTVDLKQAINCLERQSPSDILCLGSRQGSMAYALNYLESKHPEKFNKQTVYASIQDEDRSICKSTADAAIFTTYDSSKGMERKICVVFDYTESYWASRISKPMTDYEILRNIFCVAASRGKEQIIFVRERKEAPLSDKTLSTPANINQRFKPPFTPSTMFDFKYKEDVDACYSLLDLQQVSGPDAPDLGITHSDGHIDLSPCIGIYQEATFFDNYDIDMSIDKAIAANKDRPRIVVPPDADLDLKVLILTAYEVGYDRYVTQVKAPFVTDEQRNALHDRLGSVFRSGEQVQVPCTIKCMSKRKQLCTISGMADVVKDGVVYELKYISELNHEHFLQVACYAAGLGLQKGILWNVRTGEKWEVRVPDRDAFLTKVVHTITKGAITGQFSCSKETKEGLTLEQCATKQPAKKTKTSSRKTAGKKKKAQKKSAAKR